MVIATKQKRTRLDDIYSTLEGKGHEVKGLSASGNYELSIRYGAVAFAMNWEKNKSWGGFAQANGVDEDFFMVACNVLGRSGAVKALKNYSENAQEKLLSNEGGGMSDKRHAFLKKSWEVYKLLKSMNDEQLQNLLSNFTSGTDKGIDVYTAMHGAIGDVVSDSHNIDRCLISALAHGIAWSTSEGMSAKESIQTYSENLKENPSFFKKEGGPFGVSRAAVADSISEFGTKRFDVQIHKVEENDANSEERLADHGKIKGIEKIEPIITPEEMEARMKKNSEEMMERERVHLQRSAEEYAKSIKLEPIPLPEQTTEQMIDGLGNTNKLTVADRLVLEEDQTVVKKVPEGEVKESAGERLKKMMAEDREEGLDNARANVRDTMRLAAEQIAGLSEKEIELMNSAIGVLRNLGQGEELLSRLGNMSFDKMKARLIVFSRYDGSDPQAGKLKYDYANGRVTEWEEKDSPKIAEKKKPPEIKIPKPVEDEEVVDEEITLAGKTEPAKIKKKPPEIKIPTPVEDDEIVDEEIKLATRTEPAKIKKTPPKIRVPEAVGDEEVVDGEIKLSTSGPAVIEKTDVAHVEAADSVVDIDTLVTRMVKMKPGTQEQKLRQMYTKGLQIVQGVDETGEFQSKLAEIGKKDPSELASKLEFFANNAEIADEDLIRFQLNW